MGRILTPERRDAAIAWWRARFIAARMGQRPSTPALADFLGLVPAELTDRDRDRLTDARRKLQVALALPADARATALDVWLTRHLVNTGPALLLNEKRRGAVLASIRDEERQKRNRQKASRQVTLRVSEDTARQFRQFARAKKLPNDGVALKALLDAIQAKPRRPPEPPLPRMAEADLFGPVVPTRSKAATPPSKSKLRVKKEK